MPRFLAPIRVSEEYVTGNETISGNQTILSGTFGKDSYWTTVNVISGLSADYALFTNNVSAAAFYGDGSRLKILDWMTLVRGYNTTPTLLSTITTGDVYTYIYNSSPSNVTYYRYIANDGSLDAFYTYFSSGILSGLVASKSITI